MLATLSPSGRGEFDQYKPRSEPPSDDDSPRNTLREELRRLLEERTALQKTIASYQEFGYDELADRVRDDLATADRRIGAIRQELRRPPATRGRRRTGPGPR